LATLFSTYSIDIMDLKYFESLGRELRDAVLRLLRDYSEALFLAILMALILRLFIFSAYKISNPTMEPTLYMGDFVVGYKLPYGFKVPFSELRYGQAVPRRNDVLVFRCPDTLDQSCVKRVVAIAGDRVEIKKQRLILNGQAAQYSPVGKPQRGEIILNETWRGYDRQITISANNNPENFGPYVVPPDSFFALADHRDKSVDSRHWGAVQNTKIEARLLFVWLSVGWSENANGQLRPNIRFKRLLSRVY